MKIEQLELYDGSLVNVILDLKAVEKLESDLAAAKESLRKLAEFTQRCLERDDEIIQRLREGISEKISAVTESLPPPPHSNPTSLP